MDYAIYISTCDGYSDCWTPFLTLFKKYWPGFDGPLYLSSEYKDCSFEGLDVHAMKVMDHFPEGTGRIPWSRFTRKALELIPSDIILFMQEDFFLRAPVRADVIRDFADLMEAHSDIQCIHLTDQCGKGSVPSRFAHLDEMIHDRAYRISCQCALWRKSEILSVLRDWESAWEYEMLGSARSAAMGHLYLQVRRDYVRLGEFEIVPYIFTGIIKGQWQKDVPALFAENGIEMDFGRRGMYTGPKPTTGGNKLKDKILDKCKKARNRLDILWNIKRKQLCKR